MNYKRLLVSLFTLLSVTGCTTTNLTKLRNLGAKNHLKVKQLSYQRSLAITEGETLYSESLRCLSKNYFKAQKSIDRKTGKPIDNRLDITVAKMLDKTGEIYPHSSSNTINSSTAISDIAINALTKMKESFNVIDAPLGNVINTRVNILSPNNPVFPYIGKIDSGAVSNLPIGFLFPTKTYISGALVMYDKGTEFGKDTNEFKIGIDPISFSNSVETITLGMNLKMVNSETGRIVDNGSIILNNRLRVIRTSGNLFKVINDNARIFDYSRYVADPKHYALMEIVEKGIFTLMARQVSGAYDKCSPRSVKKEAVQ